MIGQFSESHLTRLPPLRSRSFHDLTGRHGDQLQRDLLIGYEVVGGGGLEDECGSVSGDNGVGGGRRRGGNAAFFILVSLYVLGQVVAPHEPLGALCAHELLLSCETDDTETSEGSKERDITVQRRYGLFVLCFCSLITFWYKLSINP